MPRGERSAWVPVLLAFALNSWVLGALLQMAILVNVDRPWSIEACVACAAVVSVGLFSNRWRCIEAFTSQTFEHGAFSRIRVLHATLNALLYAWRRGLLKFAGR